MNKESLKGVTIIFAVVGMLLLSWSFIGQMFLSQSIEADATYLGSQGNLDAGSATHISSNVNYVPLSIEPKWDNVDQEVPSSEADMNFIIHYSPNTWGVSQWMGQRFKNNGGPMTGFQCLIRWWDGPNNGDIYIGISEYHTSDTNKWLVAGRLSYDQLEPNKWYWIGFDFSNADSNPLSEIDAGEQYFIMSISDDTIPADMNDGGWWCWAANSSDCYNNGYAVTSTDGGDTWQYEEDYDMCFRTYTPEGNGGEPPIVDVSSSYWISASYAGGISLLAALGVAIRYFTIVRV